MKKRLQTILAHAGAASRRKAVELIESGKVRVDGAVVTQKGAGFDPEKHRITVDGREIQAEKKRYFLVNKPEDVVSTAKDTHGRSKVTDIVSGVPERLYPIGRLDKDTTGLIILTNDGDLAHRLSHPRYEVGKTYLARVKGSVSSGELARLRSGVELDGRMTSPCEVSVSAKHGGDMVLRVKIHEGRKRQIRRMFEIVGKKVTGLHRIGYAGLTLGRLAKGEYRELTEAEVKKMRKLTVGKGEK
jgi:23S rRNA pseudouridine2605 synthase